MNKPKLTKEEAERLIKPLNLPEPVVVLAIRGYYKNTMGVPGKNDIGIYDDAFFIITPDFFASYNGNTDPSKHRPATEKQQGMATLKPGVHYYRHGDHHIGKPNAYPAFRPATKGERLPVTRDGSGDDWGVAINIHKGGFNSTSSEGCQTIYPTQWDSFHASLIDQLNRHNQKTFPYVLIEQ